MFSSGDVISYLEMCGEEGVNLQRGMNYHLRRDVSVILMSVRPDAPYSDKVEDDGRIIIYEGHDASKTKENPIPKIVDQQMYNPSGTLNQNGLFYKAAKTHERKQVTPELVRVYEKLHAGIWVYNGLFKLLDSWKEKSNHRQVFKFKLELTEHFEPNNHNEIQNSVLEHNRVIPPQVKLEVWKRDKGKCVICGSMDNLHFDHIIPFSKGGSSLVSQNIQLLCARHNIAKRDRIE